MRNPRPTPPRAAIGEFSPGRRLSAMSMEVHNTSRGRAALRCGLHDATIVADQIAAKVEIENTVRGRLTKAGVERVALVKLVADTIWQVYGEVQVPRDMPAEAPPCG